MGTAPEVVENLPRDGGTLPAIIWASDSDGRCTHLSREWGEFTGRSPDNDLDWGFLHAIHPDDRSLILQNFERFRRELLGYQIEYRLLHRDGDYRWVVDTASPQITAGNFAGYVGAIVDNSVRKAAEERLRGRERELKLVTDSMPVLIAHLDRRERYVFANATYREWYGVEPSALIGKTVADLLGPDAYEARKPYIHAALAGVRTSYDSRVTLTDGSVRDVETVYVPLIASGGDVDGFFAIVSDITERARAQEHLNLVVGELKHHVRNLLSIVRSLSSQSFTGDRPIAEAASLFQDRLRALAAATDAITPQDVTHADVLEIVDKVISPHRAVERDPFVLSGGSLEISSTAATGLAMCLHELCTNAVKYGALSAPAGYVEIEWSRRTGEIEIVWRERKGPAVSPPGNQGFGTRLLQNAFGSTQGARTELLWETEGLSCVFRIPFGNHHKEST